MKDQNLLKPQPLTGLPVRAYIFPTLMPVPLDVHLPEVLLLRADTIGKMNRPDNMLQLGYKSMCPLWICLKKMDMQREEREKEWVLSNMPVRKQIRFGEKMMPLEFRIVKLDMKSKTTSDLQKASTLPITLEISNIL